MTTCRSSGEIKRGEKILIINQTRHLFAVTYLFEDEIVQGWGKKARAGQHPTLKASLNSDSEEAE